MALALASTLHKQSGYLLPQTLGESLKAVFGKGGDLCAAEAQPEPARISRVFSFFQGLSPSDLGEAARQKAGTICNLNYSTLQQSPKHDLTCQPS